MPKHIILTDIPLDPADVILIARTAAPQVIEGLDADSYTLRNTSAPVAGEVAEPPQLPSDLTLADFSRDRVLFDTGAARGLDQAQIPIRGTATPGALVQARVVTGAGEALSTWAPLATADSGGDWAGSVSVGRHAQWLRPEVRLAANPSVATTTTNRFGAGHVFALWGQSEIQLLYLASGSYGAATEALLADDMVQAITGAGPSETPAVAHLTAAAPGTNPLRALANVLIAARPGEKFAVIFQAVAGSHISQLLDDSDNTLRSWAKDKAVHDFATADGQHVGLAAMSWFAAPRNMGAAYGETVFGLITGRSTSGAALSVPREITAGTSNFTADHDWTELYDYDHTRWLPYGPHRFDPSADITSATSSGGLSAIQTCRAAWRAAVASPAGAGIFLPMGLEPNGYLNGYSDGAGGWTDTSHPSRYEDDGGPLWARQTAHALLQGAGLADWQVPAFDRCAWQADGSYAEVWCSAGPVTTLRAARGEAALADDFAHWTEVMGFEISGQPAQRAELVAGRVRIYPNAGAFTSSDVLSFGAGGASGMLEVPEDYIAGIYRNYPILDAGAARVGGLPLRPVPDPAILANTVTGSSWSVTPGDGMASVISSPAIASPVITAGDGAATVQE